MSLVLIFESLNIVVESTFAVFHWILAYYYSRVATTATINSPIEESDRPRRWQEARVYWWGVILNTLAGVMVGVSLAISEVYFFADGELKLWASYLASGSILCFDIALIGSGVILTQAIRKIMKNFQANKQPG